MIAYQQLKALFLQANSKFLKNDRHLIFNEVSERCMCGRLMLYLNELIRKQKYNNYYVDVEYNRNKDKLKTIKNQNYEIINITCDLIIHSRGEIKEQDNLLAIEMKKSSAPHNEKEKDRQRLCALTKNTFDDIWSFDGTCLPEHVCGYIIGIYYEINFQRKEIILEYYKAGEKVDNEIINY